MSMRTPGRLNHALTVLAVIALFPASSPGQRPQIRDSAGVRIVENPARASAPIAFTLASTPSWEIGGLKPNLDDELSPRLTEFGVARLFNGTRVVGDGARLRYFDASGRQFKVVGREGQGPQEHRRTSNLCRTRGDTVVVGDNNNLRLAIWTSTGDFVRHAPLGYATVGCFDDGTILIVSSEDTGAGTEVRLRLDHRRLDGSLVRALGAFRGGPPWTPYHSARTTVAVHGKRFYIGDPRASEVRVYDQGGALVTIIRTADPIAKVTSAEADRMRFGGAAPAVPGAPRVVGPRREPPKPTEWPAYRKFEVDDGGRVWIQHFTKAALTDPNIWTAFDADGQMLGRVTMPPPSLKLEDPYLLRFIEGGALVLDRDDDGAPHLIEYNLIRPR